MNDRQTYNPSQDLHGNRRMDTISGLTPSISGAPLLARPLERFVMRLFAAHMPHEFFL